MATFQYIAKDIFGKQTTGQIQADSEAAVLRTLDERKLFPVRIDCHQAPAQTNPAGRPVNMRELGMFYQQLADLLNAGAPVLRAMDTVRRATTNPRMAKIITTMREDVAAGQALAHAMAKHPRAFPELHQAMIRAGEHGGFLEQVLANLATFVERIDELRSKVTGALIYPMVLTIVGLIVVLGLLIFLVPVFENLFEDIPLPLPTQVLFTASLMLRFYWPIGLGILFIGGIGLWTVINTPNGQRAIERYRLYIPVAGTAMRMIAITRFCRILGTMIGNGVPLIQALAIARDATGSQLIAQVIDQATQAVKTGQALADPLRDSNLFPPQVVEMIAIAEESNQLEKTLIHIADTVERRTNRMVDQAVKLVEPIVLVAIAVAVGFVAVGILFPILTMAQHVGNA